MAWADLCQRSQPDPDDIDKRRAEYIVRRLTSLDILPGGTYEPAMISYLALYLADVRREPAPTPPSTEGGAK